MTIGRATYGADVLSHLGILTVPDLGVEGGDYPAVELDAVGAVDLVLVPSEPYSFEEEHVDELREAFPGIAVVRVDGRDLFWWGSRTAGALGRLAATLHAGSGFGSPVAL